MAASQEEIEFQGDLVGHNGWVTCISTTLDDPDMLLTGSRDKTVIVWRLQRGLREDSERNEVEGVMKRRLVGHSHFIQDIDMSIDKQYALSASWDGSLRLWNLKTGDTAHRFLSHSKDVLSVAFSKNNMQIISGSRDHTVKLWNTIGVCMRTMTGHEDWVTCVRFSPNADQPVAVSCSRDGIVKVWNLLDYSLKHNLVGHSGYVNAVTVSPDGSLCASGGEGGTAMLWDLNEGKQLSNLDASAEIYALCFSPNRYWLCGAVGSTINIWDLETKQKVAELGIPHEDEDENENKKKKRSKLPILCISLAWSHDGKTLFAGYTDNIVRVWSLVSLDPLDVDE